jgi:hypothetical protein
MRLKQGSLDHFILIAGALLFFWLLLLPKPSHAWNYYDTIKYASSTLKGQTPFSDFAAMVVGFRALVNKTDPYPRLGTAFKDLGIDWDVHHGSNHPPTSYLLAAPVAFLPWSWASATWAWLMLSLVVLSFRLYGLSWKTSLGLTPLSMLWPPASASLGQVTIVWMFGLALGYRFRRSRLFWSGASVALASLSKYLPVLVMLLYLVKRKWRAVLGFVALWVISLSLVSILNPAAIPRYVEENKTTSFFLMQRTDNSGLLVVGYRYGGVVGVILIALLFAVIIYVNRRFFQDSKDYPSTRAWMLASYFAVACLPIFWIYSLMPLLPVLGFLIFQRKIATTVICLYCILIPSIYIRGGEQAVLPMASVSVFAGLAFIFDALPFKLFQKQWQARLLAFDGAGSVSKA